MTFMRPVIALLLLITTASTIWYSHVSHSLSIYFLIATLWVFFTSICLGLMIQQSLSLDENRRFDLIPAFLIGMILLSVSLMLMAFLSPLTIIWNFAIINTVPLLFFLKKDHRILFNKAYLDNSGLWTVIIALIATTLWSAENLKGFKFISTHTIKIHPWFDILFHARQIGVFMHGHGIGTLYNIMQSGEQLTIYHYASYLISALVAAISQTPAIHVTCGLYPTLGLFWTCLAAYSVGKYCFNNQVGFIVVCGLLLIPDSSFIGLTSGWNGYYFFQEVGIGGEYAVATLGMAFALGIAAINKHSLKCLIFSAFLAGTTVFFKSQIALVYVLPLLLFLILSFPVFNLKIKLMLSGLAIFFYYLVLYILTHYVELPPTIAFSTAGAIKNLHMTLELSPSHFYHKLIHLVNFQSAYFYQLLVGIPIELISNFGIWLVLLAFALLLSRKINHFRHFNLIPFMIIISYLIVTLGLDVNHGTGDEYEVIHKTFVFPYFIIATWTMAVIGDWLIKRKNIALLKRLQVIPIFIGLICIFFFGRVIESRWHSPFTDLRLAKGLYDSAEFIRTHSKPNEIAQLSINDEYLAFMAFSERYTYVTHYQLNVKPLADETVDRFTHLANIFKQRDVISAKKYAQALGINWLVIAPETTVRWLGDPNAKPLFESNGYTVYTI